MLAGLVVTRIEGVISNNGSRLGLNTGAPSVAASEGVLVLVRLRRLFVPVFPRMEGYPSSKGPAVFRLPDGVRLEVRGSQERVKARYVFTTVHTDFESPSKQTLLVCANVGSDVGSLKAVVQGLLGVCHPDEPSRGFSMRFSSLLVRDVLVHDLPVTLLQFSSLRRSLAGSKLLSPCHGVVGVYHPWCTVVLLSVLTLTLVVSYRLYLNAVETVSLAGNRVSWH